MKADSTLSEYACDVNTERNIDKISTWSLFVARHSVTSYNQHKTSQAVLTRGSIMLITVYDSSLPSLLTVASLINVTRSYVLTNSPSTIYSSAGTPKFNW